MIRGAHIRAFAFQGPALGAAEAWRRSRPAEAGKTDEEVRQSINGLDLPVNEFDRVSVWLEVPILLREWLLTWRGHIAWARTSRADDLSDWAIYQPALEGHGAAVFDEKRNRMMMASEGEGQDDFRLMLPTCYMTGLSVNMSRREISKVISSADAAAQKGPTLLSCRAFADLAEQLRRIVHSHFGTGPIKTRPENQLKKNPPRLTDWSGGGFKVISLPAIPLSLRAQLVRHRGIHVADDLGNLLDDFGTPEQDQRALVSVSASAPDEVWREVSSRRNCWIAHASLWTPVLEKLNSLSDEPALPCDDGVCPFKADDDLRRQELDPNPPCPRRTRLEGLDWGERRFNKVEAYRSLRPGAVEFWKGENKRAKGSRNEA